MTLAGVGAVITGGGQGIGAAIARALAAEGAAVVLAARSRDRIDAVAAELVAAGRKAWAVPCDVTSPADVTTLAAAAAKQLGAVGVLINNAGTAHSAPLAKTTLEDWNRLFAVNATGTFLCTQAFLPGMLERGSGRVVNVASVAGLRGARYISAYAAAKHAVIGFTKSVAAEVAGRGVTCNAVCPGYVDTEMTRQSVDRVVAKTGKSREAALEAMLATDHQARLLSPEDVAGAVVALCTDRAGDRNGEAVTL